jgi:hypothetical protein
VAFVDVPHGGLEAERRERAHAADAETISCSRRVVRSPP